MKQYGTPLEQRGKAFTVAEAVRRNVFIFGKGGEYEGIVIRAEVQDAPARDSGGSPLPPIIVIPCPRCNRGLKIDGVAKGVVVQPLDPPRQLDLREAGFGVVQQVCVVSVHEEMGCSYVNSDAPCGARFRIDSNVIHKVGSAVRSR
jgi:hypothetical protein